MSSKKLSAREYNSPMDIPYIKELVFSLNTLGSWPHKDMGGKKWFTDFRNSKILFTLWVACTVSAISYLIKNFRVLTFVKLGRLYISCFMCLVSMQRVGMSWTKRYKSITKDFINKIHLYHHKDKNDYSMKIFNDVERMSLFICKLLHLELYCGVLLYNITPIFNSYRKGMFDSVKPINGTFEHACYFDIPFDYTTNFNGFLIIHIFNWFVTFDVASCFCIFDLYIFVIVFHLWGHLKIIKHNLRSFPRPTNVRGRTSKQNIIVPEWYNEEESQIIRQLLLDSMEHYKIIKNFMHDVSMGFGATICIYFGFHQITGCILLVELVQMSAEAIGTYGILTITLFQQLIQMSVVFELIASQSETIKDALYDVPWECMGTNNRKIVLIYLCNIQKPMELKALGILPIGVQTMASILKTSMSYFMLLRTSTAVQE